jgi:signal transduction histidine kinase
LVGFVNVLAGRRDIVCVRRTCQAQGHDSCEFELLPAGEAGDVPLIAFAPDPALGRQLNLLETLFTHMPMSIAIFDHELRLRRCNSTWAELIDRYTASLFSQVVPGTSLFELAPGTEPSFLPILERVLAGETAQIEALHVESGGIVSYWDVVFSPLVEEDEVAGFLLVATDATEGVIARQVLDHRVEERTREVERRRQVAESLREMVVVLNSGSPLDRMLAHILTQACTLLGSDGAVIYRLEPGRQAVTIEAVHNLPAEFLALEEIPIRDSGVTQAMQNGQPFSISDIPAYLALAPSENDSGQLAGVQTLMAVVQKHYRAYLGVPLASGGDVYGSVGLYYLDPRDFTDEEVALAVTFGDHAALAIQSAQMRVQAEQAAALAERSRLARDLHDAVTQTLFSTTLIAEVLPRLWERDPDEGWRQLEDLRQLTRGALAEMRVLLAELRPVAWDEAQMPDLLRQLTEATMGRAWLPVSFEVEGDCSLSAEVKEALYRIAQEALNNVAKHTEASQAEVALHCHAGQVMLRIRDNGKGFEPKLVPSESLGLSIMRERAEAIGASLEIASRIGHGTEVVVVWPGHGFAES